MDVTVGDGATHTTVATVKKWEIKPEEYCARLILNDRKSSAKIGFETTVERYHEEVAGAT